MHRAGIAAMVAILATACGGTPFPGSASSAGTPTVSSAVTARYANLFPDPPAGFEAVSQSAPGDGALTVDSLAARANNATAARALLSFTGFRDGWAREWVTSDFHRGYLIKIYRFADADGAQLYLRQDVTGTTDATPGATVSTLDLPGSPTLIEANTVDQYKNWVRLSLVARGDYVLAVRFFSRELLSSTDVLSGLTRAASDRLPA